MRRCLSNHQTWKFNFKKEQWKGFHAGKITDKTEAKLPMAQLTNINYCRMWERKTAGQVEGEVNMEGQWMKAVFSLGHRTLSNNCPEKAKNWGCLTQGRGREAVKEQRHTDREGINQPTSTHTNRQWRPFWQNTHTPAWLLSAFHLWFLMGDTEPHSAVT